MADPENNIVREWLRTLDLSHHLDDFIDNGYDDLETCKQIGEEDMDAIGVQDPHQREELRQAVARLKQEGGTAVYFTLMGPETDYVYEEDVSMDYGYAEDEDEKVHSLLNGGRSGICNCRNCECLQENHFDVHPQCYLDRHQWKWTEQNLRRGSFESAAEYRRMMSEHSSNEALVTKPRSASAVERGGFVEAIGGMSPHEQQRRMFCSLKLAQIITLICITITGFIDKSFNPKRLSRFIKVLIPVLALAGYDSRISRILPQTRKLP
ncbi:uncharacterized protein LOC119721794 [Patiria miniata]|uniref:SAM domain-containing protein n=1 Tax=Patiria miniata TaxID=46514 RepID=A0A913Z7L8_PATMI|nr:uncharacterized protein LOC119721794 [Patiria miniata]